MSTLYHFNIGRGIMTKWKIIRETPAFFWVEDTEGGIKIKRRISRRIIGTLFHNDIYTDSKIQLVNVMNDALAKAEARHRAYVSNIEAAVDAISPVVVPTKH